MAASRRSMATSKRMGTGIFRPFTPFKDVSKALSQYKHCKGFATLSSTHSQLPSTNIPGGRSGTTFSHSQWPSNRVSRGVSGTTYTSSPGPSSLKPRGGSSTDHMSCVLLLSPRAAPRILTLIVMQPPHSTNLPPARHSLSKVPIPMRQSLQQRSGVTKRVVGRMRVGIETVCVISHRRLITDMS